MSKIHEFVKRILLTLLSKLRRGKTKCDSKSERLPNVDDECLLSTLKSSAVQPKEFEASRNYYVEILSGCNLRCTLCAHGHSQLFQRAPGKMSLELFEKILDKIKTESPSARVSPYHHCEPILHPELPEFVRVIKQRGFNCAIAVNLNYVNRLEELLLAKPDTLEISVSGFNQETYAKSHKGGDIEAVKRNMRLLRETMNRLHSPLNVCVVYHMYKDNLGEDFDKMKAFARELGFSFLSTWARCINLELTLLYLREKGYSRYDGKNLLDHVAPLPESFKEAMDRIVYLPEDMLEGKWKSVHSVKCPCNRLYTNIRWTGEVNLCGWAFDDRLVAGNFLSTTPEERVAPRDTSPICKECLANNFAFYSNYADTDSINEKAIKRLGNVPPDRLLSV